MSYFITMSWEEFQKRWNALKSARKPKKVFMRDGKFIAGENINYGDLVYLQSSCQKAKEDE